MTVFSSVRLSRAAAADVGWTAAALLVAAIAAVPIIAVLAALLTPGDAAWAHLVETNLGLYVRNTLALMAMVAVIAAAVGVGAAWLVATMEFPGRGAFQWLLVLPLAAPAYIVAYLYTDLLVYAGPVQSGLRAAFGWGQGEYWFPNVRSLPGAALCLGLTLYPYVYLLARAAFTTQAANQVQAARTLGLNAWQAFFRVALPCARPAIAGGLALVLMETLADYGVADYFAIPTFSTGIFRTWLAMGEKQAALKLAGAMLILVAVLVAIETLSRRGRYDDAGRSAMRMERVALSRSAGFAAAAACAAPVLLGFVIPCAVLLHAALTAGDQAFGRGFVSFALNSITVAVIAGGVATVVAVLLAYVQRHGRSALTQGAIRISTLGYALPGALLAVGLLGPLGGVDRAVTAFAADNLGWRSGLILTGTITLLVYACVVRFLTVSFNSVSSGLTRVPAAMDAAARNLGAGPVGVLVRIHLPLVRPALAAGALLVFVDVMRELPATLLLRPFNFETLATRVYRLASDERLTEASTAALAIIVIGLIPVLMVTKYNERR